MNSKNSQKIILKPLLQSLDDLEGFLKDLWQFLPLPVCYINPNLIILDVNLALEKLLGFQPMELIGKKVEIFFAKKSLAKEIFQNLSKKKKPLRREGEFLTKRGKRKEVTISITLRQDSQGHIFGYYLAFSDISELKKLQHSLKEKVRGRTKQLQERIEELEKFQKVTVGREIKMVELKEEVSRLKRELKEKNG